MAKTTTNKHKKPYALRFALAVKPVYFATREERTKAIKLVLKAGGTKLWYSTWQRN